MLSRCSRNPSLRNAARSAVARTNSARLQSPVPRVMPVSPSVVVPRRSYATPPPQVIASDLPVEKYHLYSNATMERLLESLENFLDQVGKDEFEVEYNNCVITLGLGEHGTYVINKQPPNKQIWLSSPTSGPKRYDYSEDNDTWLYSRDNSSLGELLNEELSKIFGFPVELGITKVNNLL
ncbi:hypothetical protein QCA50_001624 [Cerrena zonata]|uniref:ferroxidase n=1 Tax=Cerrena zonata TaxID=2478898 RepID=A0AAW0GLH9_9APHY